jgi:hypothetical protein
MGGLWPGFLIQGNRRLGPKNVATHIFVTLDRRLLQYWFWGGYMASFESLLNFSMRLAVSDGV